MLRRQKVFIERLRNRYFPTADDSVWKQWVDHKRRSTGDLVDLLASDVRDSFKRRAVFLLLVPLASLNPVYWTGEVGEFHQRPEFLKTLNPDLLVYATKLIVEFITMLRPVHCGGSEHHVQDGGSMTVFTPILDKYHDALRFYNSCILILLTILPEEQCERIFPLFSLRDISTYYNMDDFSGYNPFESLLYSKVDEKWKKQADTAMRQIIRDELSGRTKPREEWENALRCYASVIKTQLYVGDLSYSVSLYADQVRFLASEEYYRHELFDNFKVAQIFQILAGDTYAEIRYRVARFVVFGNRQNYGVWNGETLRGAEMMLDEFGQKDPELAQKIQLAIDEGRKRSVENQNKQAHARNDEDSILSLMR